MGVSTSLGMLALHVSRKMIESPKTIAALFRVLTILNWTVMSYIVWSSLRVPCSNVSIQIFAQLGSLVRTCHLRTFERASMRFLVLVEEVWFWEASLTKIAGVWWNIGPVGKWWLWMRQRLFNNIVAEITEIKTTRRWGCISSLESGLCLRDRLFDK